ncbi:MAG TPA: thioredoxin domain-containing protein [Solirubrobacterales bacterium]
MSGKSAREARREERLQAEGEGAAQERRKRLLQIGSAAVFLAIVVVAVLIVKSLSETSGGDTSLEDVGLVKRQLQGIPQTGLVLGDPKAKVTLFEFGDLQCPVCKGFSEEIIPAVIDSKVRSGEAKLDFRNYTIISQESIPAGAAAIAAGEQGRGWNFIELFYRNQGPEASGYVTDGFLSEIARGAGVADIARWNKDRKSAAVLKEVEATTAEAQRLGFTGTPSFAVEGPGTSGKKSLGTPGSAGLLEEAIEDAG